MIGASSPGRGWEFFSSPPRPDWIWGPPSPLSNEYQGLFSLGVKRPGREADHLLPYSADVKNAWYHTSAPQYAFMAWCLFKCRDNFTFTCASFKKILRDNSVIQHWATGWTTGIRSPARATMDFSFRHRVQTGSGTHQSLLHNEYQRFFPRG
jgi:hypothetical protein